MKMYGSVAVKLLCILNFGTRWRWLVTFTLQPLYSKGYRYVFPLGRKLVGCNPKPF
jgi:hypothetical protein